MSTYRSEAYAAEFYQDMGTRSPEALDAPADTRVRLRALLPAGEADDRPGRH
ncbi:hypothetical protein [Nonomuraea sp. KM90]|uniref:hypothetical protein n=1 Tax=Nonomuraea sp. KM90 TaxID=3457428 RepID=UPI003FCD4EC8